MPFWVSATCDPLDSHPKVGASWEGLVLESLVGQLGLPEEHAYFWAAHAGGELDLLLTRGTRRVGIEIKRTSSPKVTRSMHTALEVLELAELIVIHAGRDSFRLARDIRAVSASRLGSDLGLRRWPRL